MCYLVPRLTGTVFMAISLVGWLAVSAQADTKQALAENGKKPKKAYADQAILVDSSGNDLRSFHEAMRAGMSALQEGQYNEAVKDFSQALYRAQLDAPDELRVMVSLNKLGVAYSKQGKLADAESRLKRSLELSEKYKDKLPQALTMNLDDLAGVYVQQKKYADAEKLYRRALELEDPTDVGAASVLDNFGWMYVDQGKFADAIPLHKKAIQIWQNKKPNSLDLAVSIHQLGVAYRHQKKYEEAEPLLKQALEMAEKAAPSNNPNLKRIRDSYTMLLKLISPTE